jgi:hypothetical protein
LSNIDLPDKQRVTFHSLLRQDNAVLRQPLDHLPRERTACVSGHLDQRIHDAVYTLMGRAGSQGRRPLLRPEKQILGVCDQITYRTRSLPDLWSWHYEKRVGFPFDLHT